MSQRWQVSEVSGNVWSISVTLCRHRKERWDLKSSARHICKGPRGQPPAGAGGCHMAPSAIPKHQPGPKGLLMMKQWWQLQDKHSAGDERAMQSDTSRAMPHGGWRAKVLTGNVLFPRGCMDMCDGMRMCRVYVFHTLTGERNRYQLGKSQIY